MPAIKQIISSTIATYILLSTSAPVSANTIFKCRDQSGTIVFKDTPCKADESFEKNYGASTSKPAISSTPDANSPGSEKSPQSQRPVNPGQDVGSSAPSGAGQKIPPPGLPEPDAEILEHSINTDPNGNAVIRGKLRNKGKSLILSVTLTITLGFQTKTGDSTTITSKSIDSHLDNLQVGETRNFEVKTQYPAQTVANYLISGMSYKRSY